MWKITQSESFWPVRATILRDIFLMVEPSNQQITYNSFPLISLLHCGNEVSCFFVFVMKDIANWFKRRRLYQPNKQDMFTL